MDCLFDKRGDCMSIAFTISYSEYKELIDHAYKNRGGIDGQRGTLKTSTAIRIRKYYKRNNFATIGNRCGC